MEITKLEGINTPDDFIHGVTTALRYWLLCHTDPDIWTRGWINDQLGYTEYMDTLLTHGISNHYFEIDVKKLATKQLALEWLDVHSQCPECETICEYGFEECECDDSDGDNWESPDLDIFIEWLDDFDSIMYVEDNLKYTCIEEALKTDGFEIYRERITQWTSGVEEECKEAIEAIENAESNQDKLVNAMAACGILHVNGNILKDYGEEIGFEYWQLNQIREDGLISMLDPDELREWIEEN